MRSPGSHIAPPATRDASYALYFTLAFGVGSLWVALYGVIIDTLGEATGVLLLRAAGWMEVAYRDELVIGDHVMVIGEVVRLGAADSTAPLIFLQGGFHTLELTRS